MYAFAPAIGVAPTRTSALSKHRGGVRRTVTFAGLSSPIRRIQIGPLHGPAPVVAVALPISEDDNDNSNSTLNRVSKQRHNALALQLRLFLARLAHMRKSLCMFRSKHAVKLQYARLAMASVFGLLFLQRMLWAPTTALATASTTLAATEAGVAIPASPGLLGLIPEGMKVALRPFTESFGVVFLSEFGDKSMFATALMAMKHSPYLVLVGALIALTVMTLIACFLGQLMHLLPTNITHYSTIALFVFFGFQMLWSARKLSATPGQGSEKKDAEELVAENFQTSKKDSAFSVLAKISSLIFVAEWCDRSMIATMALAASSNSLAVVGGATVANILCTGLAVGSAALVASKISERTVAIIAGILFEFFAVFTWFEGPEGAPGS